MMATSHHQPASINAALAMLPSLPRPVLSRLVSRMIERLDQIDGDADGEENDTEDAFVLSWYASGYTGPGCPVSDCDTGIEDDPLGCDPEEDYCTAHEDHGTGGFH
ncbi:MAG: hypothetical protein ABIO85_00365 [Sphingomicrobium sp.]